MSYITYKQYDSRWGSKNYNGSSSMATAGCGPTSVAMLAYAVDGKTTPWDVAKFMQKNGYAIRNNGTAWSGIPAAMKHFGLQNVKNVASMEDVFSYLSKGYCAVFLFKAGSRGGITWTTSGHYVAVTGYKVENGKHKLYTRDSGGRNHTGWYCYETQMKGLIPQVWVGYVGAKIAPKKETTTKEKTKATDKISNNKKIKENGVFNTETKVLMQLWLRVNADGIIGPATIKALQKKVGATVDGVWGTNTTKKLQTFLISHKAKIVADGKFGPKTCKALQHYLNTIIDTIPKKKTPVKPVASYQLCVDVSEHQGKIDWAKVKKDGVKAAVIRAGYGKNNIDERFKENITGAIKVGLPVLIYWFSYAYTEEMATNEGKYCAAAIKPWKNKIKAVYFDWEYDSMNYAKKNRKHPSKTLITNMTKNFCKVIKNNGYKAGFYYNYDYKVSHYNMSELKEYSHWYALYSKEKMTDVDIQQYSNSGKISGISGRVDVNWIFNKNLLIAAPAQTTIKKETTTTKTPVKTPVKEPSKVTTKVKYKGSFPTLKISKTTSQVIADACSWAVMIAGINKFHYGYTSKDKKINAHHNGCYFCKTQGSNKKGILDKEYTYCCNPFVHAAWSHGGLVPSMLKICKRGSSYGFSKSEGYYTSKIFKNLGHPKMSSLKKGDVLCNDSHVALYIGDGIIAEASGGDDNKRNSKRWNNSIHVTKLTSSMYRGFPRVHRFISNASMTHAITLGDISDDVGKLQAFLNWYGNYKLDVDRKFMWRTEDAVRDFQKKEGLKADGICGEATLKKMKTIEK